ncbi:MAG: CmcI family methyltransferase [Acidimicrobiales bacterium]|nr:CmcI family methyltransferase [Acidimicrobiales bacterium]
MYPFWDTVINPLVLIADARRIVEIGALRGETTAKMLDDLRPDAELHVIDPLPQFDPSAHEAAFPGRYIFHKSLSLEVLSDLPAFDLALIDGDHNWYTVYNECRELAAGAKRAGEPLPLMILHDVGWPYGRRDLYYNPSDIPQEHRQPHERKGMMPGRTKLLPAGGMNITLENAVEEGGPRNGVRTGLDDFIAEHDKPIRQVILPIYFGLAIVADEEYLAAHPDVVAFLDRLESHEGTQELLELSEQIRLEGVVFEHNIDRMRNERLGRATDRYIDLLKGSLLDEHYLENEERIDYLLACLRSGRDLNEEELRDPVKARARNMRERRAARESGAPGATDRPGHFAYADMGRERLDQLEAALRRADDDGVDGDIVDVGVGRGGSSMFMKGLLDILETPNRAMWVVDEFRASPPDGARSWREAGTADLLSDLNQVRDGFARFDLLDDDVRFLQGKPSNTLPDADISSIAVLRLGPGLGAEAGAALEALYDRVAPGGIVVVEDEHDPQTAAAVQAFRTERGIDDFDRIAWTGTAWIKADETVPAASTSVVRDRAPLAPTVGGRPTDRLDLSIVVVFHNMRREAERTLHSLTRGYQRGIDDLHYEVIVVDNGSDPDQALDAAFVESFGAEFRLLDMGADAPPSPTHGLNEGIAATTGTNVALMIDGAHVLTPGVLRHGMTALDAYSPTVVATQQWYVGPGQQPDLAEEYTQSDEDALFTGIEWPSDGYRLFEIGHFIGSRDWFDGILESNCLFAPRELLEQVGGFDDSFSMPGGGYANLEIYERLASHPDVTLSSIIGEGSFHQVHGGTTTNDTEVEGRRAKTFGYGEDYASRTGRTMRGPARTVRYVGGFESVASNRTRSRRLTASSFGRGRVDTGVDGLPERAHPMPDELVTSFVDAYWHSLAWQDSTWRGQPLVNAPSDLLVYQELLDRIRPDHVVVTTVPGAGTAHYLATVCAVLGHGEVIAVGRHGSDPANHPRLTKVRGVPSDEETIAEVRALVGDDPHALVVISSGAPAPTLQTEFAAYSPMVRPGSYVIMENTIYGGHPVWPAYGPSPLNAVRRILVEHGDFMQDTRVEKHGLTFNPGGFLRRSE